MPYVRVGDVDEWRWEDAQASGGIEPPEVSEPETGTGPYEGRTRLELVELARERGVKGAAQMRKADLIDALRE